MSNNNNKVKISVIDFDESHEELCEVDKSKSLEDIVTHICHILKKPEAPKIYGLKLMKTNDGKFINSYITEDNLNGIKDAYSLKLVYSLEFYVKRIFDYITDADLKVRSYEDLYNLSVDPEFIKELVKTEKHLILLRHFTDETLQDKELTSCLITIVHLFQKGHINEIPPEFLNKIIVVLNSPESSPETVKYGLSVLHKIMYHRGSAFNQWKTEIIKKVSINDLTPYIWCDDKKDLQYGALLLINTIVRYCQGYMRKKLIKEISLKKNREYIYTHIILPGNINKNIAHELYVYQTYILSQYADALNSLVAITDEIRDEFEIEENEISRRSILMDFDEENANKFKSISVENLADSKDDLRSLLRTLSEDNLLNSKKVDVKENGTNSALSILTLKSLYYYKNCYNKTFRQSQIEERIYEPGIFSTAETITKMLAKIFHIGREPDKSSTLYQPTVFNCSTGNPFFYEIFSRSMWLLSKTRREMKASTIVDYPKVMNVLEQKIRLVLEDKPLNFTSITEKLPLITFESVLKYWQKQKDNEMNNLIKNHPCIQEIKERYKRTNEALIFEQRINYVQNWETFPKIDEKKVFGNFAIKLSKNKRELVVQDFDSKQQILVGNVKTYPVADINYIILGKACCHVKNKIVKNSLLAFSFMFNDGNNLNFYAKAEKIVAYWTDAINLLLERTPRSEFYKNELEELIRMDLMLHLIEIQNISIPRSPPPIPPPPKDCPERPPLPQKPYNNFKAFI